mmetsp:Transcript_25384/g.28236  ORF Transcript_25384/g.28236 Transcript_25384/m.28236 type:complete len:297 (+) Transcript_25384:48-938(+)
MAKKVLLMGKNGSGKTSMRSIIFANYIARDTSRLGATIDVEHSHVKFLGDLVLNLWDCGGQEAFMENYLATKRDHIFKNVAVLIYVFDVESRELEKDMKYYTTCLDAINQYSKSAKVFCLLHKMDTVPEEKRNQLFRDRTNELTTISIPAKIKCFATSIWDETLYKAWSMIVHSLIPNIKKLTTHLDKFCEICQADEAVLFEKATFLVIAHATRHIHDDPHRFEKISNIIKKFKLSCSKSKSQFSCMEVKNNQFAAYLEEFTPNTYIMLVTSDLNIESMTMLVNIKTARAVFEKLS